MNRPAIATGLLLLAAACAASPAIHQPRSPSFRSRGLAYPWRGIMIDVARYYVPIATLRRLVDLAAHDRLNVLHLHFTDNEAWRLPSRRYPRLPSRLHYSEAALRELNAYAQARGVLIVPEIDVPAHAAAAIRAYPGLSCGQPDVLCYASAATFAVNVLNEALAFFPGPYVHTGGDEVTSWSFEQRRGFERRLSSAASSAHRTMIVWDDEADAAPKPVLVEAWHLAAAANAFVRGHRTIFAADGPFYFDAVQGSAQQEPRGSPYMSTLEEVYNAHPPSGAFGVEAVLWTQYVRDDNGLWYMLLPRESAFAQVAALAPANKSWKGFRDTVLPTELLWLQAHRYSFRVPAPMITVLDPGARYRSVTGDPDSAYVFSDAPSAGVAIRSALPNARIWYRSSHSTWRLYVRAFRIRIANGVRISAKAISPDARASVVTSVYVKPAQVPRGSLGFDDVVSP